MNTATETMTVPKGWVTLAAIGLAVAAIAGVYLGVVRSLGAHDLPSDTDTLATTVPGVANAKPLADTAADEAKLRSLVREEVATALKAAKPAAPKPVPKADDDTSSGGDATAALNAAAAGKPSKSVNTDGATTTTKPAAAKPATTKPATATSTSSGAIPF